MAARRRAAARRPVAPVRNRVGYGRPAGIICHAAVYSVVVFVERERTGVRACSDTCGNGCVGSADSCAAGSSRVPAVENVARA